MSYSNMLNNNIDNVIDLSRKTEIKFNQNAINNFIRELKMILTLFYFVI